MSRFHDTDLQLLARVLEGRSIAETAAATGLSEPEVRTRLEALAREVAAPGGGRCGRPPPASSSDRSSHGRH